MAQNAFFLLNYVQYARFSEACQLIFYSRVRVKEHYSDLAPYHAWSPHCDFPLIVKNFLQSMCQIHPRRFNLFIRHPLITGKLTSLCGMLLPYSPSYLEY